MSTPTPTPSYDTPDEAEAAFYRAFEEGDLDAMMSVWADDADIVCVHPMGPREAGTTAIRRSWREILSAGSPMRFTLGDATRTTSDAVAVHCVEENISYGARLQQQSVVIATNVYRNGPDGWKMIVHHASPGMVRQPAPKSSGSVLH